LLLNPPGKKLYIRDYYCSKVSQADYIYHPVDLVYISGFLKDKFDVKFIDCIVEKISLNKLLTIVVKNIPDYIIMLVGSVSLVEDLLVIKTIKSINPKIKIVVSGDLFRENTVSLLEKHPEIDAVVMDFFSKGVFFYVNEEYEKVVDIIYRLNGKIINTVSTVKFEKDVRIPIPKHELFVKLPYRYPFVKGKRFATILSAYGCPFKCTFCIIGTLPYKLRFKDDVIEELKYINSLGIREVFFLDQTFGANREYYFELCKSIIESKLNIKWFCFSRVDVVDKDFLFLMKKSGCHTIIFGIESGDDTILSTYRKGYDTQRIKEVINFCKKIGIDTVGTFILGLPNESKKTILQTLKFIKKLPLDYASFNVAVPRAGTELRKEAINLGFIDDNFNIMDQSGSEIAMPTKTLTRREVLKYRRKMVLSFYFNLKYLWNKIIKIHSFSDLTRNLRQCVFLIKNTFF
ncbi:MAG: radical SAM protein, partial [Endomicrobia bacterium]|nr:radical SAM protein [Endomicrobiia bacterium]